MRSEYNSEWKMYMYNGKMFQRKYEDEPREKKVHTSQQQQQKQKPA